MRYALIGLLCAVAILWGLIWLFVRPSVADEGRFAFDQGLELSYRVTHEGGSLGQVRYEVFAEQNGRQDKIFEGINSADFHVSKGGPRLILIRFCDGMVEHLSAVVKLGGQDPIAVQPDIHCSSGK